MIRSLDDPVTGEQTTPPAERPGAGEAELARGRVEQTPFSMINWVAVAIAAVVVVALVLAVVAYVVA